MLALGQLVISLDYNIVYVALPDIGAGLGFSDHDLQWVVSAYVVATGGFLLLGGRAADLLGRRRTFVVAALLYAGSSLVGGLSDSPGVLVAVRAVQGVGGSLLFPATLSLINTMYDEGARPEPRVGGVGCRGSRRALLRVPARRGPGGGVRLAVGVLRQRAHGGSPRGGRVVRSSPWTGRGTARGTSTWRARSTATGGITLLVFLLVQAPAEGWGTPVALGSAVLSVGLLIALRRRGEAIRAIHSCRQGCSPTGDWSRPWR